MTSYLVTRASGSHVGFLAIDTPKKQDGVPATSIGVHR